MKVSTKSRYGLRAIIYIAAEQGRPVFLKEISEKEKISLKYLDHIFKMLKEDGIIKRTKNGYVLTKIPAEISIYEIINSIEGDTVELKCEKDEFCENIGICRANSLWTDLKQNMNSYLKSVSLQNVIDNKERRGENGIDKS